MGQEGAYGIRTKGVVQCLTLGETQEGLRKFHKVDGTELGQVKMMQEMPKKGGGAYTEHSNQEEGGFCRAPPPPPFIRSYLQNPGTIIYLKLIKWMKNMLAPLVPFWGGGGQVSRVHDARAHTTTINTQAGM